MRCDNYILVRLCSIMVIGINVKGSTTIVAMASSEPPRYSPPKSCWGKPAKVRRKPTKRGEIELQKCLEKYKPSGRNDPHQNAWLAYKHVKESMANEQKKRRNKSKGDDAGTDGDLDEIIDNIRGHLSLASRLREWANRIGSLDGAHNQEQIHKEALESLSKACEIFGNIEKRVCEEGKDRGTVPLDDDELGYLTKPEIPPYPYLCTKNDVRDMTLRYCELELQDHQQKLKAYRDILTEQEEMLTSIAACDDDQRIVTELIQKRLEKVGEL